MEVVRKKIEVVFNEEEKQVIEKVINILEQIEMQPEEVINALYEQYEDYQFFGDVHNPLTTAIDYLGCLIKYEN